ncbi:RagB/SusD family nutrient uptake outer membrane protein [Cyclobacterium jeungdonense]|uniref:RagB/SusD family nutrient uptake outer membrane protein n=1 Tax=Cyclobacterium jeungdonense TaxID=708087 RepID=A0ABT8CB65_9BACT|nr:RagB/SusD family nutrient uptake outer membrane protein [Cyclobacterium jeungdonense]MDN3690040.1 RagB/SusD family nutrient uptake outer membrane protein [Cyclobacterium jeungdonense]
MKKIATILAILIMSSCSEDFLNLVPESSITSGNFYKTEDHFNQALVGAYASIRGAKGSIAAWTMGEMRSDNTHLEFNITNRGPGYIEREYTDFFMDDVNSGLVANKYNSDYIGIARTNEILDQVEEAPLSQEKIDQIYGEASFLRALLYFDLVRYFGGVPLYLTAVKGAGDAYLPRASVNEVYQAIIQDLENAINRLDPVSFPQNGRANEGAARMVLADVYLTIKDYPKAESELSKVIQMGYSLLDNYGDVFELSNKNSTESIFEIQYQQGNQGQNSDFLYPFIPLSADVSLITGISSQNLQGGGWNTPTFEMIAAYEDGDERLPASIGIVEGTGQIGNMFIDELKSPVNYVPTPGKRTYPFIKKYLNPHALERNTDDNFPIYRFSEALLSMAEALNEQGRSADALPFLNEVRERADLDPVTETNQQLLREIIERETRVELAFENKRWCDLLRTDRAIEVMNANGVYLKEFYAGESYLPAMSYNVTTERLLFPIPLREIRIGNLEQNPGY